MSDSNNHNQIKVGEEPPSYESISADVVPAYSIIISTPTQTHVRYSTRNDISCFVNDSVNDFENWNSVNRSEMEIKSIIPFLQFGVIKLIALAAVVSPSFGTPSLRS
ncbi:6316_t:CDS:2 [Diversispora eburnea]|uniref:6316_t:CDS:1 n=1 Tax=Diversispora eburnea TaxID=1213867 RepID=A0A9N9BEY5_9GLOM|nr:6316_t:CDS:2 [Diversispora eburnea]